MTTRTEIIEEARSWIGTSFHHQGRTKKKYLPSGGFTGGGCDCIGLLVGVAKALDIKSAKYPDKSLYEFDRKNYSRTPDGESLQDVFDDVLTRIDINDIRPADVVLLKFEKDPQHVAIFTDYKISDDDYALGIIHSYASARKVVEHRFDKLWQDRIVAAYRIV